MPGKTKTFNEFLNESGYGKSGSKLMHFADQN